MLILTTFPRTFKGKLYYGASDIAKILGVNKTTVLRWNTTFYFVDPLFTADLKTNDGVYLYEVERVRQLASVYHKDWTWGGYQPSSTTSEPESTHTQCTPSAPVANEVQPTAEKPFQKISAATLEAISHLSPDELEAHDIIQPARVLGYICPICGAGSGSNGTGMVHNKKIETHTSFTCFSGSHSFNVLKLCALHYNLDTRNDFQQLVEKICADFDIKLEYEEFSLTSGNRSSKKFSKPKELISPEELKLIQQDLAGDPNDLWEHFMKYQPDHKWRGFDFDFLKAHGCRHILQWTPPKSRLSNQVSVPSP